MTSSINAMTMTSASVDQVIAEVGASIEDADEEVTAVQAAISIGDYFMSENDCGGGGAPLIAYGLVLDHKLDPDTGEPLPREEWATYELPRLRHFRASRCFSPIVPDGEIGDTHVSSIVAKITQAQFEDACRAGWPQDDDSIGVTLGLRRAAPL